MKCYQSWLIYFKNPMLLNIYKCDALISDSSAQRLRNSQMWCNLTKSVWNWTCDIFSFLLDWSDHLERYILLKNPTWIGPVVQKLWEIEESSKQYKQKEIHSFCKLYLTINASNFRLTSLDHNTTKEINKSWCKIS